MLVPLFADKKHVIFLVLCLNIWALSFSQEVGPYLDLPEAFSIKKRNVYTMKVSPYCETKINEISGKKFEISSCKMAYNGLPLEIKSCKTRGHTTLHFKRKSFSISLENPLIMGEREVKKLALNSLVMDQNYYRNRLSFLLMEKISIFHLQNTFAEVMINGNTSGLYLAIQKPEDYIRALESTLLVRREYEGRYTIDYSKDKDAKGQLKRLRRIPKLTKAYEGQQLYDSLNTVVHLDHYFRWLAFNYLIKNGDYTDELFLYISKDKDRFDIIPWDYDDIFQRQPHESFERRNKILEHKLLFSGEAYLDMVIDKDKLLYAKFLHSFQQVLEVLSPEEIKGAFEKVYMELYPYYADQELIAQSESDHYGLTDLHILRNDLQRRFQTMLIQRLSIESIIDAELRRLAEQ